MTAAKKKSTDPSVRQKKKTTRVQNDQSSSQSDISELETLKNECEKFKDLAARAQADLQNAKVRSQKEGENIRRFALQSFLLTLLPTIDHFTRSLSHLPKDLEDHEWVKGILAIEKELSRTLESVGLQKIDALGKSIDPDVHEVLLTAPGNEGEVVEIVEDGFLLHGSVLRPAKVKAGSG